MKKQTLIGVLVQAFHNGTWAVLTLPVSTYQQGAEGVLALRAERAVDLRYEISPYPSADMLANDGRAELYVVISVRDEWRAVGVADRVHGLVTAARLSEPKMKTAA